MYKAVLISSFEDKNVMADLTRRRYHTVKIHLMDKTPIEWYSKSQFFVETPTYGSEYAAARICNNHIVELCNTLRLLVVTLPDGQCIRCIVYVER